MRSLTFIEHAQLGPLYSTLNRGVRQQRLIPFVADDGAGKRRVLLQWARLHAPTDLQTILWTNLIRTHTSKGRKEAIASSITMTTFGRALFGLRMLRSPVRTWDEMLDQKLSPAYDDDRFVALRDRVALGMQTQGIRAWIINDAHLLDHIAVEHILTTWKECHMQFAVILAAKRGVGQAMLDPLKDQLDRVPDTRFYQASPLVLKTVDEEEFSTEVLAAIFDDLAVDFNADVTRRVEELTARAWAYTHGHWDATVSLATAFDDELGAAPGKRRLVTQSIVDRVFERLIPPIALDD